MRRGERELSDMWLGGKLNNIPSAWRGLGAAWAVAPVQSRLRSSEPELGCELTRGWGQAVDMTSKPNTNYGVTESVFISLSAHSAVIASLLDV